MEAIGADERARHYTPEEFTAMKLDYRAKGEGDEEMSRKKCKRKVWKLVNPIQHAIDAHESRRTTCWINSVSASWLQLRSFRKGEAGLQEWADLTGTLNVCEAMARGGIGPEALDACKVAEQR